MPPLLSGPVVGGSGQYYEDAAQEIKQIASSLKALLHPHAKEAAAKDITGRIGLTSLIGRKLFHVRRPPSPKHSCLATSRSQHQPLARGPSLEETEARDQKPKARPGPYNEFWAR